MKKILIGIISVLILALLLFISFSKKNVDYISNIVYQNVREGNYLLELGENSVNIVKGKEIENGVNVYYMNNFDKILYNGEIEIDGSQITLKKGIYLINISELNSKYKIKGEGFIIENDGPSTIFIDSQFQNSKPEKTNIFSENSVIDLKLVDENNGEVVNDVYLYPHMFLKFTPTQNKNIKGADLPMLINWFSLDYFGEKILSGNSLNQKFVSKVIGEKNEKLEDIKNIFLFLKEDSGGINQLMSLKNGNFSSVAGEKLLKKYSDLFLNEVKKIVYYKNLVLRGIGDLFTSSNVDDSKIGLLVDTMKDIESISLEDYEEVKNILYFYTSLVVNSYETDNNKKTNFSKLYNQIEDKEFDFKNEYVVSLNNIYSKLDLNDNNEYGGVYKNLNGLLSNLSQNNEQTSYLTFFLNKTIISGFGLNIDIESILDIFNEYTNISLSYYQKGDETLIRTGIAEYSKMTEELLKKLGSLFFLEDRNSDNGVLLRTNSNISDNYLTKLTNSVEKIFSFFKSNKSKLWEKEKSTYENSFEKQTEIFDEYTTALKNYENYVIKYTDIEDVLTKTPDDKVKNIMSSQEVIKYLTSFNYLDTLNIKISPRNENYCRNLDEENNKDESSSENVYCYKITNLIVNNRINMEFLFTPSDYNKISNIIINGDANKNRGSYKLEDEKKNLEDFKTNGNNDEYSFEDFFYYTFLQNESTSTTGTSTVTTNTNVCTSDDSSPTIASFKRTLILENEGRFSPLLGFIKVDYEDICVEDIEYNVSIKNAGLTYGTTTKYTGIFSSKYIPKEEVFENPSIIFQDENGFSKLYGNAVNFQGKFKIKELKSNLEPFFERFENYNNIINSLNYDLQISKFSITYITTSESLVIENGELRLGIRRNQIYSFVYNGKEILKNNTNYEIKDLDSILKLIK